ncbi:MAG: ribosome-associated translation inhibitor RaiA [Clostridia bacterium]|nr:ribosome-associated translation inhibitor RaiA [Clostridia bacterium]
MIITYVGRHLSVPEDFKPIAEAKLAKFDKFFRDEPTATVKLSVQKNRERVEVTIMAGGMIYRGEESDETFRNALDLAVAAIERQIRKNKTRLEKRLRETAVTEIFEEPFDDEPIIRKKEFTLHPMTPEEAILQMNLLGHSFFLYSDSATGEVNVVYRRNDGDYGVIVPQK